MLSPTQIVRLTEGIRVARQLPGSTLVTSAYLKYGPMSQAELSRQSALFTAFGAHPIAAPCDFKVMHNPDRPFLMSDVMPSWKHLAWLDEILKEELAYRLGPQCDPNF